MSDTNDDEKIVNIEEAKKSLFGEKYQQRTEQRTINSTKESVDWLNETHGQIMVRGQFRILWEKSDGSIEFMEKKSFIDKYNHRRLLITADGGNPKSTPMTEIWLKSPSRRMYDGITLDPSCDHHYNGLYNLFKGYKLKKGIAGDVTPFLDFIKNVICAGHEQNYNFLVALIAQMFQKPGQKPGIAVVIRGDEGVGKSFFVQKLCALMAPYYFKTSNPAYIFGDHNGQLKDKLLLHLEEAIWAGSKKDESLLKDMIDGNTLEINDKFVPVFSVPNHLHLFITGNPNWLVAARFQARRIFALHAADIKRKDIPYFTELDQWFKSGGDAALMYYFLNYKWDMELRLAPITREHIEQQKQTMSGLNEWVNNWLELGEWPYGRVENGHCYVIKSLLCHDYNNSPLGKRRPLTDRQFGIKFLELFPLVVDGEKQYGGNGRVKSVIRVSAPGNSVQEYNCRGKQGDAYDIPPVAELRAIMDFNFGGSNDWDEKSEWTIRHGDNKVDLDSKKIIHQYIGPDGKPF